MRAFESNWIPDSLSMGQVKDVMAIGEKLVLASTMHAMVILADGVANHICVTPDPLVDDLSDAPPFTPSEVQAYLAFEQASMSSFATIRAALIQQGYPVETEVPAAND